MKTIREMSRAELAAYVQDHLRSSGVDTVLSGGACVSIYSNEKYVSLDLDLIQIKPIATKRQKLRKLMSIIGFIEKGRYFTHEATD